MRRENLPLWIAAISLAGIGWHINLGIMFCEMDPFRWAGRLFPAEFDLTLAMSVMRGMCSGCVFAALILMGTGLLQETIRGSRLRPSWSQQPERWGCRGKSSPSSQQSSEPGSELPRL